MPSTVSKRPRTAEDFYLFCKCILEYENYEQEELCDKRGSPLGSTGSVADSIKSESPAGSVPEDRKSLEAAKAASSQDWNWNGIHFSEEDSYDLVTCYCTKPFAGRPMIECSKCLTWIHLSCAKIKKTNIPEVFICVKCKNRKLSSVTSSSSVRHKKRVSVWSRSGSRNVRLIIKLCDQLSISVECLKMSTQFSRWGTWNLSCFIFWHLHVSVRVKRTCKILIFDNDFVFGWLPQVEVSRNAEITETLDVSFEVKGPAHGTCWYAVCSLSNSQ